MSGFALAPYFHPTTICLVDDNESFLQSFCLELPSRWACQTFTDPHEALAYLNEPPTLPPLVDRCFTLDPPSGSEAVIRLDLNLIEQEINHVERFRRVSVVVVDYAMPSLDGLAFCRALTQPYLRKAMLTGVADEKLAVEAFNAGLIHRFIPKHMANATGTVMHFIEELQQEYFNQYTARLQTALSIDPPAMLVDTALAERMRALMADEALVEYYLVDDPPGFLLLRSNGSMLRVVVLDPTGAAQQLQYVRRHDAPEAVIRAFAEQDAVGLFSGDSPDHYFGDEAYPWRENVVTAERVRGKVDWLLGVFANVAPDIDFDPRRASYDAYLSGLED